MRDESASGVAEQELVELLADDGRVIGTAPKSEVHHQDTPLHRAFSCYVFDRNGRLLVTRRALDKRTFPGLWTNSVCGHPAPGEPDELAIVRRATFELGLELTDVTLALGDFRYRAEYDGIVENEICPVYLARTDGEPAPHREEVADLAWWPWADFSARARAADSDLSHWSRAQTHRLHDEGHVARFLHDGVDAPE